MGEGGLCSLLGRVGPWGSRKEGSGRQTNRTSVLDTVRVNKGKAGRRRIAARQLAHLSKQWHSESIPSPYLAGRPRVPQTFLLNPK